MRVSANAARQNLRDGRVGNHREAKVDCARSRGVFLIREQLLRWSLRVGAQRQHEGKDAFLVVEKDLTRPLNITRLDPAESHGGTRGKVKGMDGSTHLFAVRDKVSVPAPLDALFRQLLRHRSAVAASGHENQ